MKLKSYLYGALKRAWRYLAHFEQSKTESRPSSIETESPLHCELRSKSSAHSQARMIGISRHSENRYHELSAKSLRDCFAFTLGVLQRQSHDSSQRGLCPQTTFRRSR